VKHKNQLISQSSSWFILFIYLFIYQSIDWSIYLDDIKNSSCTVAETVDYLQWFVYCL